LADARVVALEEMVPLDPTILEVADLPPFSFGCASDHGRDAPVEVTLPATTPYDSDPSARSDFLTGYRAGYCDYLVGEVQTPYYQAGHYRVAERGGYMAGIAAAIESQRQAVSQQTGTVKRNIYR
jgi:hypothetical protein